MVEIYVFSRFCLNMNCGTERYELVIVRDRGEVVFLVPFLDIGEITAES
mgnify:CR=1 FL=1